MLQGRTHLTQHGDLAISLWSHQWHIIEKFVSLLGSTPTEVNPFLDVVVDVALSNYLELLVGPLMLDRSKVLTQTKSDSLILQVGGWTWGYNPTS